MDPAIDPARQYSFAQACAFLPSPSGKRQSVHRQTLYRYRDQGRLAVIKRRVGSRVFSFVRGSDLIRLINSMTTEERPAVAVAANPE